MVTFLTIAGILIAIFVLKFIYDSFLTDNTDKRFEEYRKNDPIGAAEIDPPKTKKEFHELVNALSNEVSAMQISRSQINLGEKYPNYLSVMNEFGSKMDYMELIHNTYFIIAHKAPILTYRRVMGHLNYVLVRHTDIEKVAIHVYAEGIDGEKVHSNKIVFDVDLPQDEYISLIESLHLEICANPSYLKIASKGFGDIIN